MGNNPLITKNIVTMKKVVLSLILLTAMSVMAEQMPAGYYASIEGQQDAALKDALRLVIRPHTVIPYGSGMGKTWEVFYYSDRDSASGEMMDMYCDTWHVVSTPGQVASGCNIEHSFAKSWWGGAEYDQYKDCYHLNPSNSTANSSRSNYPLGVPTQDIKSGTGSLRVGKATHTVVRPDGSTLNEAHWVFEPKDEYKGDFARAYFYMATCYGHDAQGNCPDLKANGKKNYPGWRTDNKDVGSYYAMRNDSYLEFQDWEIDVLLQWHRQDPVSDKEIKRADAVSDFQHNRNPYIDYPELVEYIWGNQKGQVFYFESTTATESVVDAPSATKVLRAGTIIILRDGVAYDLLGRKCR